MLLEMAGLLESPTAVNTSVWTVQSTFKLKVPLPRQRLDESYQPARNHINKQHVASQILKRYKSNMLVMVLTPSPLGILATDRTD